MTMREVYGVLIRGLLLCVFAMDVRAQSVQERLNVILQNSDIQELNRFLPQVRDSLDDMTRNVAEGYLYSGMNRPDLAFKCYDNLIKQYSATYDMTNYLCLAVREQINMGLLFLTDTNFWSIITYHTHFKTVFRVKSSGLQTDRPV